MVKIIFGEDQYIEKTPIRGFKFGSQDLREEYLSLCKQLIDNNDSRIRKRVIEIIADSAKDHIKTLPDAYKTVILNAVDEVVTNGVQDFSEEISDLVIVNLVAYQFAILFTYFPLLTVELPPKESDKEEIIKELKRNAMYDLTNTIKYTYEDEGKTMNWTERILADGSWKNCSTFLEHGLHRFNIGIDIENLEKDKFIPVIGFLKIREIVEGILEGINYIGLSFVYQDVDGEIMSPELYFDHDIGHYTTFKKTFENVNIPNIIQHVKQFRHEVREKTSEPSILYAIDFILFILLHEENNPYEDFYGVLESDDNIKSLLNVDRCTDMRDMGMAIPKKYRVPSNRNPIRRLDQKTVENYFDFAVDHFVKFWKEYKESTSLHFSFITMNKKKNNKSKRPLKKKKTIKKKSSKKKSIKKKSSKKTIKKSKRRSIQKKRNSGKR